MDPNHHSTIAASIYSEIIDDDVNISQIEAGALAIRIAEMLEHKFDIGIGRIPATDQIDRLRVEKAELVTLLKEVLRRIDNSEHWWMDSPDRGGFDAEAIRAVLAKAPTT